MVIHIHIQAKPVSSLIANERLSIYLYYQECFKRRKLYECEELQVYETELARDMVPIPVFPVSCFGVRVSVMFHFMFFLYTFTSVWVDEWPPFGK